MSPVVLMGAFLGGVLPTLIWLLFWQLEDRCEPEPKRYIFLCFLGGAVSVLVALPLERFTMGILSGLPLLASWALFEEIAKFGAAYLAALRLKVFDEPLDAVIYLVTAALGFSAVENTLFLVSPLTSGDTLRTIVTGDLRFMGATLLHILTSATIGIALSLSFYKGTKARTYAALGGVVLAVFLHTLFNFFILREGSGATFWIFTCIWFAIVAVLLLVERIKEPTRDYC